MLATGTIIAAPATVLSFMFSKYISMNIDDKSYIKTLIKKYCRGAIIISLLFGVALFLGVDLAKEYFKSQSLTAIYLLSAYIIIALFYPIFLGSLQGMQKFIKFGIASSLEMYGKFFIIIMLIYMFSISVNGALLACVIGSSLTVLYAALNLKNIYKYPEKEITAKEIKEMLVFTFPVLMNTMLVLLLSNIDIILVRNYVSAEEAGYYAGAAILGRVAFFLPGALLTVLFPSAAKLHSQGKDSHVIFFISLLITTLISSAVLLVCGLWPSYVLEYLLGDNYIGGKNFLPMVTAAMFFLSIGNVVFTYKLARSEYHYLWILGIGTVLMLFCISIFHETAYQIITIMTIAIMLMLILMLLIEVKCFISNRKHNSFVNESV